MMDANWRIEEALMTVRDGVYLDPAQEARFRLDHAGSGQSAGLRSVTASALAGLARRLDPESAKAAVWHSDAPEVRPA